jgi:hypothetical protein
MTKYINLDRKKKRSYGKFNSRLRKSYALSCGYNEESGPEIGGGDD